MAKADNRSAGDVASVGTHKWMMCARERILLSVGKASDHRVSLVHLSMGLSEPSTVRSTAMELCPHCAET